jgi:osmotically-inducible protein OsmY
MRTGKLILILASVLAVSGIAFAGTTGDIQNQILKKTNITNLEVRQENNAIVLAGQASVLKDKFEAEKIAKDEGKTGVVNQITLVPATTTDRDIEVDIARKLSGQIAAYSAFNAMSIKSYEGNVVLEGKVRDAYLSDYAQKAAMEVRGVKSVNNRIEVLPPSQNDDRLRVMIYNRMSRDDRLFNYFLGGQSSILVIVENSRVTLAGYVTHQLDRTVAEHLVRGMPGVLSVENQIQVRS